MGFTLRTIIFQIVPVVITVLLLVISLTLLNSSTSSPDSTENIARWLAPLNFVTLVVLFILIMSNLIRALIRLRARKSGSRYTLRLMSAFAVLTLLPVLVVSYFSMNFIGQKIDSWYDINIERALDDSLELAQRSLTTGMSLHLRDIELIARELFTIDKKEYPYFLDKKRQDLNAYEILLLDSGKHLVTYSSLGSTLSFDHFPSDHLFRVLTNRGFFHELEPGSDKGELYSRVAVTLQKNSTSETYVLTALFPVTHKFSVLSESIESARTQYRARKFQRNQIKYGFRLSLFIIMVLSVLFSLWAAFVYSKRLTSPIRKLLEATLAVASGDLHQKLPVSTKDDFSLLARSFNTMTSKLSNAQSESERSRLQVQRQHDYLNVVLNHLTSGVMTLNESLDILRINAAGSQLLQLGGKEVINHKLTEVGDYSELMPDFVETIMPHLHSGKTEWKTEIIFIHDNKRCMFVCQGVTLPELIDGEKGVVLVFDDMTEIIQAEHDAAWGEVARRLAHEIKNPLTPIQLSAERLQYRLLPELSDSSADLLKRMTQTITQQVESMKTMVNAFSEYARTPSLQLQKTDLNTLVIDIIELYLVNEQQVDIRLELGKLPEIKIDVHRVRQAMVNIVKNSLEALESEAKPRTLLVATRLTEMDEILIQITDNGSGINPELLPEIFDPYISNKSKGSGLGLAIVKKTIEEHSGNISVRNADTGGAIFTILLPLT